MTMPTRTTAQSAQWNYSSAGGWLVVVLLLVVQWALFRRFAQREIVWAYATMHDQAAYLSLSYETYHQILSEGLLHGLWANLFGRSPNGCMIYPQAALLFSLIGPSRLSALTLNFAYFALFQCVLVWTLRWLSGRWSIAFIGLGLLLSVKSPFATAGGMMDFRIDFIAFCLFGVFLCLVLRSGVFASWRWSLLVGVAAALLGLFRFITLVYLVGILGTTFVFLCVRLRRCRAGTPQRRNAGQQLRGLVLASLVLAAFAAPAIWSSRQLIYGYYITPHITSAEKYIWAQAVGVTSIVDTLLFYPRSAAFSHAGATTLLLVVLALGATSLLWRFRTGQAAGAVPLDIPSAYFVTAASVAWPLVVLTADTAKSPVVGSILIPPLILLVLLTVVVLSRAAWARNAWPAYVPAGLASATLAAGVCTHVMMLSRPGPFSEYPQDVNEVLRLHDLIGDYSQHMGWKEPRIFADAIADYFHPQLVTTVLFERHGILLAPRAVGGGLLEVTEDQVTKWATDSDFVVVTPSGAGRQYPFDVAMQAIRPALLALCERTCTPIGRFHMFGRDVVLYVRPPPGDHSAERASRG